MTILALGQKLSARMNQGGHKTGAQLSAAMKSAPLYRAKNLRSRIPYNSSVGDKKRKKERNPTMCCRGC